MANKEASAIEGEGIDIVWLRPSEIHNALEEIVINPHDE